MKQSHGCIQHFELQRAENGPSCNKEGTSCLGKRVEELRHKRLRVAPTQHANVASNEAYILVQLM